LGEKYEDPDPKLDWKLIISNPEPDPWDLKIGDQGGSGTLLS